MDKKQIELLERVLLLMKYDNKQTYSENQKNVLVEQGSMGGGFTPQTQSDEMAQTIEYLNTPGEPRTPFKEITLCNGTYKVPESATPLMNSGEGMFPGLKWDKDEVGFYNTVKQLRVRFSKPNMFSSVSGVTEETKVYYPTFDYLNSVMKFNLPIGFKIPKGTKMPREEKTEFFDLNLDEILLVEMLLDIVCTVFTNLPVENFDMAIHPEKYDDESRGWKMKPHVYYENPDKPNEWIPYDPKTFIDERSEVDAWWDKYGIFIEITGQALIDLACSFTGPVAFGCMVVLGAAFNLPIGVYYMDRGNTHSAAVSFVFSALPFLHGAYGKAATALVEKLGLETFDKACLSISSKVAQQAPKTGSEWAAFYKSLSTTEREVMVIVSEMEQSALKGAMEVATKKAIGEMVSKGITVKTVRGIFGSLIRGDIKSLFTKFPYIKSGKNLSRFIGYTALDLATIEGLSAAFEKVKGKKLSPIEQYGTILYITSFPEEEQINVANTIIESVKNNEPESIEAIKTSLNLSNELMNEACKNVSSEELDNIWGEDTFNDFCKSSNDSLTPEVSEKP